MGDRNRPRAFEEDSAKALGLTDLRAGFHEVLDNSGTVSTTICVESIWTLRVIPFLDQRGFITVVNSGTGNGEVDMRRAVIRTAGAQVVRDVSDDPVFTILPTVDLLANPISNTRDGISYELIVSTQATHATIQFSNPCTEPWRSLEVAALQFAAHIAEGCDNETLGKFVSTWGRYCERPL